MLQYNFVLNGWSVKCHVGSFPPWLENKWTGSSENLDWVTYDGYGILCNLSVRIVYWCNSVQTHVITGDIIFYFRNRIQF